MLPVYHYYRHLQRGNFRNNGKNFVFVWHGVCRRGVAPGGRSKNARRITVAAPVHSGLRLCTCDLRPYLARLPPLVACASTVYLKGSGLSTAILWANNIKTVSLPRSMSFPGLRHSSGASHTVLVVSERIRKFFGFGFYLSRFSFHFLFTLIVDALDTLIESVA